MGYIPPAMANSGYSYSIVQKLKMREVFGKIKRKPRGVEMKAFSRLPSRLAFFLRDVVPINALTSGHIFLGFSNCGQFLLSYTCTPNDASIPSVGVFSFNYVYRLHWWTWIPYAKAKKVAEVTLFTDHEVSGSLHISFCQWPTDTTRLVVFGYQVHDACMAADDMSSNSLRCYLTVTQAPSLTNCQDCVNVASSYDADDVAEAWNTCIRMSCLKHGATVHTQFDIVSPYPRFEPRISLKVQGTVLINTGNYFHALSFDMEPLGKNTRKDDISMEAPGSTPLHKSEHIYRSLNHTATALSPAYYNPNPTSVNVGMNEEYTFGSGWSPMSTSMTSPHGSQCTLPSPHTSIPPSSPFGGDHSSCISNNSCIAASSPYYHGGGHYNNLASPLGRTLTDESEDQLEPPSAFSISRDRTAGLGIGSNNCRDAGCTTSPWSSPVPDYSPSSYTGGATRKSPRIRSMTASLLQRGVSSQQQTAGPSTAKKPTTATSTKSNSKFSSPSKAAPLSTKNNNSRTPVSGTSSQSQSADKKRKLADQAYDLTEENFGSDGMLPAEKLSTFRRKRLAERKYEFTEEDGEEVEGGRMPPLPITTRLRARKMNSAKTTSNNNSNNTGSTSANDKSNSSTSKSTAGSVLSRVFKKESAEDLMVCVTERKEEQSFDDDNCQPMKDRQKAEEDYWSDILEEASYPELFSPGGCIKKDTCAVSPRSPKVISAAISPRPGPTAAGSSSSTHHPPHQDQFQCKVKFTRRYIEVDDELISVTTDVENEEGTALNLPVFILALPMEVHGSGYTQMQMVSSAVADRLTSYNCIRVEQRSLDLEQFCHETATKLCAATNKKFWFCNDYDVEVIDLDPCSGDVVAVAVILIQAAILTKSQSTKFNVSSLSRKHYQASFKFTWNLETGNYSVVDSVPFKEIYGFKESPEHWNPARSVASSYIKNFRCEDTRIKVLNNQSVINGVSLKAVVDPENLVALIMNDLE